MIISQAQSCNCNKPLWLKCSFNTIYQDDEVTYLMVDLKIEGKFTGHRGSLKGEKQTQILKRASHNTLQHLAT